MDPGFYEDLAGRLYGLLIGLEGRLDSDDAPVIHQFTGARHYGLALEEIARTLAARMIGITDQERAGMLALAGRADVLARANRTPLKGELVRVAARASPAVSFGSVAVMTGMDAAYYEDLAGRLYGLVIRLGDRLPADDARWLHHVTEAGEYGLALEDMAGMLARGKIAITGAEREDMLALADRMKLDGGLGVPVTIEPSAPLRRPVS